MRDQYEPRGGRGYRAPGGGLLRRLVVGLVFAAILIGGSATVYYVYMKGRGKDPVGELSDGLGTLADKFKGGKSEVAGEKLRELGRYLEDHGDEIDRYGGEVERRLEGIKAVSEDAYRAAKKKIDEFRGKKAGDEAAEEREGTPADGSAEEPREK